MPRPLALLVTTSLVVTRLALGAPPAPSTGLQSVPRVEVLGLTDSGALVFRRGATLFRVAAGTREAVLADVAPLGALTPVHVGLAAPGGAAVVYPAQPPVTTAEGPDGDGAAAHPTAAPIALDRPIRLVRVDGDGDEVLGELQPRCPASKPGARPGRRRPGRAPAVRTPTDTIARDANLDLHATLDLLVAWTTRDVVVLGTLTCGDQSEPFVLSAPLRPPIADGAHDAVADTVDAASRGLASVLERAKALAALEPSSPLRLVTLAAAYADRGDAAAAVSTLWRVSALGAAAKPALDDALSSEWAKTLEGRAAYHALVSSNAPLQTATPHSPGGAASPPKESP